MTNQRPAAIVWFERVIYLSLGLGAVNDWIVYRAMRAAPPDPTHAGPGMIWALLLFTLVIFVPLTWFSAHRASNVARWILVVLLAIGLLGLFNIRAILDYGGVSAAIAVIQVPLCAVAIWLLFRPSANDWFAGRRPVDPDIFG